MMLFNGDAFDRWSSRSQYTAQMRVAAMHAAVGQTVAGSAPMHGEWSQIWGKIKSQAEGGEFTRHGTTAQVDVLGALDYKYSLWSWYFDSSCYRGVTAKVMAAANDASIKRIVLYVDSPGGHHHGLQEASDAIWAARETGKEVIAVVDPEAASAGYWLASQASRIVGIESGWVGSLGSQIMVYSMKRMHEESGLDIEVIRAAVSPNKNLGIPYEAITDEARADRKRIVDMAGEKFVEHVARGRGLKREDVLKSFGQGLMYFTPDAISRGMIDEIGSLDSVLADGASSTDASSGTATTKRRTVYAIRNKESSGPLGSKRNNGVV